MEFVIRMKTVTRILLFLGFALVWLVLLVIVNNTFWNIQDDYVVLSSLAAALGSTIAAAWILHS